MPSPIATFYRCLADGGTRLWAVEVMFAARHAAFFVSSTESFILRALASQLGILFTDEPVAAPTGFF